MYQEITIRVTPQEAADPHGLKIISAQKCGIDPSRIIHTDILRRSIDARQKQVMLNLTMGIHIDRLNLSEPEFIPAYRDVSSSKRKAIIVGAGPAGLFAALRAIELGIKPILLERGKCVKERRSDLAALYKQRIVNPDSNFGFGEGGAGSFSDGKLYTRSKKRGNNRRIMEILVYHGADPKILIDSHPHVGTDKLPQVIENIRTTILKYGGEIHFKHKVDALLVQNNKIYGVSANEKDFFSENVILATGHSARDIYRMLFRSHIFMEAKDFAVGLRLEHPQHEIDIMQYHTREGRGKYLPAAEYSLSANINGRGVYSFCMCPGGVVVPSTTSDGRQVVNGMSSSARNTPWANSAIVTSIGRDELKALGYEGLFSGMEFQEDLEAEAWKQGIEGLNAPGQRMLDFIRKKESADIPQCSYKPGVTASRIDLWFPEILTERIRTALQVFGTGHKGFLSGNATLLGVETRTSSPIRITRDPDTCRHIEIAGLYPCGEGAGYSGGIIPSAIDGEKCTENINFNVK